LSIGERVAAVVIGAGPAGLATGAELGRRGVPYVVLERGDELAYCWANLYDSLTLHTGKHMSVLPGMRFPRSTPLFPPRLHFVEYLRRYARERRVSVTTNAAVRRARRVGRGWQVETSAGPIEAGAVIVATGIISEPRIPAIAGRERFRGRVMHSVEYRRPAGFEGRRVLVVGVGNSGGEIGSELARAGAKVTVAVRSGANVVPLSIAGVPIQYLAYLLRKLPRGAQQRVAETVRRLSEKRRGPSPLPRPAHGPLDGIPLIGFNLIDAIREELVVVRPGLDAFTETGVRFADGTEEPFDDVLLATGFSAALGFLEGAVTVDEKGFARRRDRVTSAEHEGLYFVGHNYDATGGLYNIRRDSVLAASLVAAGAR
jgi:thioredoxin reductase